MKLNIRDTVYIIFLSIALFLLYEISQNGRYQTYTEHRMIDTRTGKIYESIPDGNKKIWRWDLITKEVE